WKSQAATTRENSFRVRDCQKNSHGASATTRRMKPHRSPAKALRGASFTANLVTGTCRSEFVFGEDALVLTLGPRQGGFGGIAAGGAGEHVGYHEGGLDLLHRIGDRSLVTVDERQVLPILHDRQLGVLVQARHRLLPEVVQRRTVVAAAGFAP